MRLHDTFDKDALMDVALEREVRTAAFIHLRQHVDEYGVIAWTHLLEFTFRGESIFLVGSGNGIFKPRQLDLPISLLTAAPSNSREAPYEDVVDDDGLLNYRYRGRDPDFHQNRRLRSLFEVGLPAIHLHGVERGRYLASTALLVEDSPKELTFKIALTELEAGAAGIDRDSLQQQDRSRQLRLVQLRVNQASFRERVLRAYRSCCALCRLRHSELLDAAHIVPHSEGGRAIVPNGLSLCKIHHAAYDNNLLGIRPDLVAEIRADVLEESDGPMLAHGLQALHRTKLIRPRGPSNRPDLDALEYRYEQFRAAG